MEAKHIANYRVRAHDVSENKRIHLPALLRILQEASLQHAIILGASIWDKRMENKSWVLIKKELKIHAYPSLNAMLRVTTYPSAFDKFFAYRDWIVHDEEENIVAVASSQWAVINLDTRKMEKLPPHLFDIRLPESNLDQLNFKLRFNQQATASAKFTVHRYDLDWNGHLNNSKLIEYMLAAIPQENYKEHYDKFQVI